MAEKTPPTKFRDFECRSPHGIPFGPGVRCSGIAVDCWNTVAPSSILQQAIQLLFRNGSGPFSLQLALLRPYHQVSRSSWQSVVEEQRNSMRPTWFGPEAGFTSNLQYSLLLQKVTDRLNCMKFNDFCRTKSLHLPSHCSLSCLVRPSIDNVLSGAPFSAFPCHCRC